MAKGFKILLLAALLVLASLTIFYSVVKTLEAAGGIDLHSYWYAGHFVRQGTDPYAAYLQGLSPGTPIRYLDSLTPARGTIAQPGLANVPANTAPVVLLLSNLAFFTWPTAKLIWMVINLALMFLIPGLTIRLLPSDSKLNGYAKTIIFLAFLGMFGTRNIAGNGQTSLLIFAFMLLALIRLQRSWWQAGIWLGLALSKYSLSLPIFIYFIIKKQYRAALTALLVQALAVLLLAGLTRASPLLIPVEYWQILEVHTGLPGIHLGSLFPGSPAVGILASTAMTIAAAAALIIWYRHHTGFVKGNRWLEQFSDDHLMSALLLWTLLVAYHRAYDSFVVILFFALVVYGLSRGVAWRLSHRQRKLLALFSALAYIPLSLPARGVTFISKTISNETLLRWLDFQGGLLTLTLLALMAATLWLLYRINIAYSGRSEENLESRE